MEDKHSLEEAIASTPECLAESFGLSQEHVSDLLAPIAPIRYEGGCACYRLRDFADARLAELLNRPAETAAGSQEPDGDLEQLVMLHDASAFLSRINELFFIEFGSLAERLAIQDPSIDPRVLDATRAELDSLVETGFGGLPRGRDPADSDVQTVEAIAAALELDLHDVKQLTTTMEPAVSSTPPRYDIVAVTSAWIAREHAARSGHELQIGEERVLLQEIVRRAGARAAALGNRVDALPDRIREAHSALDSGFIALLEGEIAESRCRFVRAVGFEATTWGPSRYAVSMALLDAAAEH